MTQDPFAAPHGQPPPSGIPPQAPPGWPGPAYGYGPPPAPYGSTGQPHQPRPSPYGPYGYPVPPQTDGTAIVVLVLAISSFVVLPVIPAVVALVLARSAERDIAASGGRLTGESLVRAGRITAWIHLGLCGLLLALFVGFLMLFGAATFSD